MKKLYKPIKPQRMREVKMICPRCSLRSRVCNPALKDSKNPQNRSTQRVGSHELGVIGIDRRQRLCDRQAVDGHAACAFQPHVVR